MQVVNFSNVVDLTPENFQQVFVEQSQSKIIMVQFWSPRSEACQVLGAALNNIAKDFTENLILARVNCDEQQSIAMQFGVQSIPTVAVVKAGQPVDGFSGVQPEEAIRELLAKHMPRPEDELLGQALFLIQAGNYVDAFPVISQAYEIDNSRADIKLIYADTLISLGKLNDAEALLAKVGLADQDVNYHAIMSKLDLAKEASDSPEIKLLQAQLNEAPDDLELKVQLAIQLNHANRNEESLSLLFDVLKKDLGFGDAKKTFLDILSTLPAGDVLATQYRRKLYTLLY